MKSLIFVVSRVLGHVLASISAIAVLLSLGLAQASGGGAAEAASGAEHHINWWTWSMDAPPVGWFLVDFFIFVLLLVRFGRKPMYEAFARRHNSIKQAIEENERAFAQASRQFHESRDKLAAVDREVTILIGRIKEEGVIERERVVAGARSYADRLRHELGAAIAQEGSAARDRLRDEVARMVLERAEALLADELTIQDKARLLEEAIIELEQVAPEAPVRELKVKAGGLS